MNAFGLDIGTIDLSDIEEATNPTALEYEKLPGVPAIMTRAEAAAVSGVSLPTIDRLIASKTLKEVKFTDEEAGILKCDLLTFFSANMLHQRPLIDEIEQ